MAVFTLEDEQIVWTDNSYGIWPSDMNLCRTGRRRLVRLDGKIVLEKLSFQTAK